MSVADQPFDVAEFEGRYRTDPDPWRYLTSAYERDKYAATLAACGPGPFRSALELGGSIGVFSELLAPRCERMMTLDFSPTAVTLARNRLARFAHAEAVIGRVPESIPPGPFDLIVASELLYYLPAAVLAQTLDSVVTALEPGGRLVCVHWRSPGSERPMSADQVHAQVRRTTALKPVESTATADYLLDILELA
jgi:SAM-dependent methyltransferase